MCTMCAPRDQEKSNAKQFGEPTSFVTVTNCEIGSLRAAMSQKKTGPWPSGQNAENVRTAFENVRNFPTSKLNTPRTLSQIATISECRYRWLRVPDLNLRRIHIAIDTLPVRPEARLRHLPD